MESFLIATDPSTNEAKALVLRTETMGSDGRKVIGHRLLELRPIGPISIESAPPIIVTGVPIRKNDDIIEIIRKRRKKRGEKIEPKKGGGKRRMLCKRCGEAGHFAKTCPNASDIANGDATVPWSDRPIDEIRDEVRRLQSEGKHSLLIARTMGLSLKRINDFWDHSQAASNGSREGAGEPLRGI